MTEREAALRALTKWREEVGTALSRGYYKRVEVETIQTLNVVLAEIDKLAARGCNAPAPDRSTRTCDKPQGHGGPHWTYGGQTLEWPSDAETPVEPILLTTLVAQLHALRAAATDFITAAEHYRIHSEVLFHQPIDPALRMIEARERLRTQLAAQAEPPDNLPLRIWLWLRHGHQQLYGDDGEHQCSQCMPVWDYKRAPLEEVVRAAVRALAAQLAAVQQERDEAKAFVDRCAELGAPDTDIVKHALEDQARVNAELVPLSIQCEQRAAQGPRRSGR